MSQTNTLYLIVDSLDVYGDPNDSIVGYTSMNMITGITVGNWVIAPGVLLSENFDISYGLGTLTIVPETLTVKANDTTAGCNGVQPAYTFTNSIYQYEDADSNVSSKRTDLHDS
jgi:hypothetical protein